MDLPVTLSTVTIEINNVSIMDAIMTRDQRTTSHRVLDRDSVLGVNCTSANCTSSKLRKFGRITRTASLVNSCSRLKLHCNNNDNNNNNNDSNNNNNDYSNNSNVNCINNVVNDEDSSSNNNNHRIDSIERSCAPGPTCEPCHVRQNHYDWEFKRLTSISNCSKANITTWLRLGSLLVLLLVISVQGAPTSMALENRRLSEPKWVNPCGLEATEDPLLDVEQFTDEQLLAQVVLQAKNALDHAQLFCDDYIKRTFNTDFNDWHSTWKDKQYDWLPGDKDIPKQLGENLKNDYFKKLEVRMLDTALLNAYEYMQRYAVGLEQIVWDQEDHRLEFLKQFKDTEYKLRTVLCELQVALSERGVAPRDDVTRDVMPMEYRSMAASATYRNLRDWLIFRDYMNGLEYIVQVFEHLKRNLES